MFDTPSRFSMPPETTNRELAGLTAVVTGAASGIGRATALELAKAGAAVLVHTRQSKDAARTLVEELRAVGVESDVRLADLADAATHAQLVDDAWQWRSAVDVWVNNAGVDTLTGEAARWSFQRKLDALWRVDVSATIKLSRLIGAKMKARGSGAIVNTGWDQAEIGMAGDSGEMFAAVKGAVMAFTRSLARSLAPEVRVNCVAPGWIKTAWGRQASDAWQRRARAESLLDRWGTPEDVARVTRFLVSPAAGFVTGHTIPVNGGLRNTSS
ncbi:MAG TPA: SDR family NAD(P)-dependent oxidoreductase [Pirellulales bacterium]|jgi:3-oxoacyl-[acyl-carrier protein] reductase|nr:SDR family NAD(P)-dependent oxidoreductase [Pirellulales bacterium]